MQRGTHNGPFAYALPLTPSCSTVSPSPFTLPSTASSSFSTTPLPPDGDTPFVLPLNASPGLRVEPCDRFARSGFGVEGLLPRNYDKKKLVSLMSRILVEHDQQLTEEAALNSATSDA